MARYRKRIYDDSPSLFGDADTDGAVSADVNDNAGTADSDGDFSDSETRTGGETHRDEPWDDAREHSILPVDPGTPRDVLRFISFGSGSSGNSAYIGDNETGIIIDAGIDGTVVTAALARYNIPMSAVKGILVTHDHGDHVRYLYSILRRNKTIPLFCTPRVLNGMLRRHSMSRRVKDYHHAIYKEIPFKAGPFEVTAFEVFHDGSDNVGFSLTLRDHTFVVATDLGVVSDRALHYITGANYLMIEANYDRTMLINGDRPEYLKARILGDHGHLDNEDTAALLSRIYTPSLRNIFLCHLSEDNNTPEIAVRVVSDGLRRAGVTAIGDNSGSSTMLGAAVQLMALPRFDVTPLFTLTLS